MRAIRYFVISLLVLACRNKPIPTVPFKTQIADINIDFPLTVEQLLADERVMKGKRSVQYFSETASRSVYWFYNWRKANLTAPTYAPIDSTQIYGMVILMNGKAAKLDSVRKQIESQFDKPMQQLAVENIDLGRESIYVPTPPVYTCAPSLGTQISLRMGSRNKGDYSLLNYEGGYRGRPHISGTPDNPDGLLRIAISYRLEPDEAERFAIGYGAVIWKDSD